jgi:hypothetical protein
MDAIQKMKRLAVLNTQADNTSHALDEITNPQFNDFIKWANHEELDELRAKVKARYEGYLKEIMDEAKALLGEDQKNTSPADSANKCPRCGKAHSGKGKCLICVFEIEMGEDWNKKPPYGPSTR